VEELREPQEWESLPRVGLCRGLGIRAAVLPRASGLLSAQDAEDQCGGGSQRFSSQTGPGGLLYNEGSSAFSHGEIIRIRSGLERGTTDVAGKTPILIGQPFRP